MQIFNPLSLDWPTFLYAYTLGSGILLLVGFTLRWQQTIDRTVPNDPIELNEYQGIFIYAALY